VHETDVARSKSCEFTIWGEILEQFNFVTARRFQDCKLNLSAGDTGDLFGQFSSLMRGMRKFEAKYVTPESEGFFEI
jgi:hypothetical protein